MEILALLGSLGARSSNLALLEKARDIAPENVGLQLFTAIGTLPFFDPDASLDAPPETLPAGVRALREAIERSDAVLIACPEYGHSLPGVLKNAIDWLIGSGELEGKIVSITASVPHPSRGRRGLAALRQTLEAVRAQIVDDEPIARGDGFEAALQERLQRLVAAVAAGSERDDSRMP